MDIKVIQRQKPFTWFDEYFTEWLQDNKLKYNYISTKNCPNIDSQELEELQIEDKIVRSREIQIQVVFVVYGVFYF